MPEEPVKSKSGKAEREKASERKKIKETIEYKKRVKEEKTMRDEQRAAFKEAGFKTGILETDAQIEKRVKKEMEEEKKLKKSHINTSKNPEVNKVKAKFAEARREIAKGNVENLSDATMVGDKTMGEHLVDLLNTGKISENEYFKLLAEQKQLVNEFFAYKGKGSVHFQEKKGKNDKTKKDGKKPNKKDIKKSDAKSAEKEKPLPVGEEESSNKAKNEEIVPKIIVTNERPLKLINIARDVLNALKITVNLKNLRGSKKGGRNTLGSYNTLFKNINLKYTSDLKTLTHEIGHFIADMLGIEKEWKDEWDDELIPVFSQFGSTLPAKFKKGLSKKQIKELEKSYTRNEAMAEYIKAWIFDRDEAAMLAPEFTKHFEKKLPYKIKEILNNYGHNLSVWYSSTESQKAAANIFFAHDEELKGTMGKVIQMMTGNYSSFDSPEFSLDGFWGKVNTVLFDSSYGYNISVKTAMRLNDVDPN